MLEADPASSHVVRTSLTGPAGSLEAILRVPLRPAGAAVVAHPHPLHGGTMHTKVVHRAARLLSDRFSLASLRFNFRGVGASAGVHDNGRGEVDDLVAAIRLVRGRFPEGPLVVGGFSFGSVCALEAAQVVPPDLLYLIGLPLLTWDRREMAQRSPFPVVWIQGEKDEFGGAEMARDLAEGLGWNLSVIPGADHFFTDRLDLFENVSADLIGEELRRC